MLFLAVAKEILMPTTKALPKPERKGDEQVNVIVAK